MSPAAKTKPSARRAARTCWCRRRTRKRPLPPPMKSSRKAPALPRKLRKKSPPRLNLSALQNEKARFIAGPFSLGLHINAGIGAAIGFLPAALADQETSQLFMRVHPQHRVDMIFCEHRIPGIFV